MCAAGAAVVSHLHATFEMVFAIALALQRFAVTFAAWVVLAVAHHSAIVFMEDAFMVVNSHGRSLLVPVAAREPNRCRVL